MRRPGCQGSGTRAAFATMLLAGLALPLQPARAQQGEPVSRLPADAQLVLRRDAARAAIAAQPLDPGVSPRAALYAIRETARGLEADVFVQARRGAEAALRARGARIGTRAGDWLTARVPLDRLEELANVPGVSALQIATRARPHTDSSVAEIGAAGVRRRTTFDAYEGAGGRGAIIGLVDSGIDYRHPDFREDDTGRSRVLWLWDQAANGSGPGRIGDSEFLVGVECTRDQLSALACNARDTDGHGTHVAGIAAGDGSGARRGVPSFDFAGVAPAADLIVVATDFSFVGIVEAVDYIFRRAEQLGRPAVVNLSLGGMLGPHDGSEAPAVAIDALVGPGRVVVASVGNEGDNRNGGQFGVFARLHAEATVPAGGNGVLRFELSPYLAHSGAGNDLFLVQAFHSAADTFDVHIDRPNGTRVTLLASQATTTSLEAGGTAILYHGSMRGDSILGTGLELGTFSPTSASHTTSLYLGEWINGGTAPSSGSWRITFANRRGTGSGLVDAYVAFNSLRGVASFVEGGSNRRLVGTPADGRRVISVGAYSTRDSWPSVDGRRYAVGEADSVARGDVLLFSSPGPTRDGRLKPEITAPGRAMSTLSRDAPVPVELVHPDSAHALLEGTSMAAPHVTGTVALMLARRPTLTPEQVLQALRESARQDAFTAVSHALDAGFPNATWGHGKLNAAGALARVAPAAGRVELRTSAPPPAATTASSRRGSLIPLQRLRLLAYDPESLVVRRLTGRVSGSDPAFRLAVVRDVDGDGRVSPDEAVIARSLPVALAGEEAEVTVPVAQGELVVPKGGRLDLLLVAELSGASPNGAAFRGALVADAEALQGTVSGAMLALGGDGAVPAAPVRTTVLASDERVNLSQNPGRAGRLVVSYDEMLQRATVYDFAGRQVRALPVVAEARRVEWDLRTDGGSPVANGAYVLVLELPHGTVRRTLFVAR